MKVIFPIIIIILAAVVFRQKSISCSGKPVVDDKTRKILKIHTMVVIAFFVSTVVLLLPAIPTDHSEARKVRDASNLARLGTAMKMYMLHHGGDVYYAASLQALWDTEIIREPQVFLSPALATPATPGVFVTNYECILDMIGSPVTESDAKSYMPFAWNKKGTFTDGRNVVFFDSHVEFFIEEDFQKLMSDKILPFVEAQKKKVEAVQDEVEE